MALVPVTLLVLSLSPALDGCTSTTFAQSQPRSLTWTSLPAAGDRWQRVVPLLFGPPPFLDRWKLADFSLISATLVLPCLAARPEVYAVPEAWIEWLPSFEEGARALGVTGSMCDLIEASNVTLDEVPGCQDWGRIEAWRRLRIFHDIQQPVRADATADGERCADGEWRVSVSSMLRRWMADRSPWTRQTAVLPVVLVSPAPVVRSGPLEAQLHISYWMDSKSTALT